jgi:hypothetical protein
MITNVPKLKHCLLWFNLIFLLTDCATRYFCFILIHFVVFTEQHTKKTKNSSIVVKSGVRERCESTKSGVREPRNVDEQTDGRGAHGGEQNVPDTFSNTLCPTTTGPVARYEEFLLNINSTETKLISPTGLSQADQLSRAEQCDIEVLESSKRIADSKRKENCPGRLEDVETDVEMKQKDNEVGGLECSRRMEYSNRQEKVGNNPRINQMSRWTNVRQAKIQLEQAGKWKELSTAEERKFQNDGKQLREEMQASKRKKFGKAGKWKLTELEETLLSRQMMRMKEILEIEKNLKLHKLTTRNRKFQEGWKGNKRPSINVPSGRNITKNEIVEV